MTARPWVRRSLAGTAALLLVVGVTSIYVLQEPSAFTVDDAVGEFRSTSSEEAQRARSDGDLSTLTREGSADEPRAAEAAGAGAGTSPSGPATPEQAATASSSAATAAAETTRRISSGVYTYKTDGYEAVDALNGSRHDYPAESPITVAHNDCGGFVQRWQPLEGRWDESDLCVDEVGVSIRRFTTRHEFFKQRQTDEYLCPAGTYVYRDGAPSGASWSWTCQTSSSTFATKVTFAGVTEVSIGGAAVAAHHYRYDSTMDGATRGTQVQERWVHPETGLLLKMTTDIDSEADSPFGTVHYEEHYVLHLKALEPHR